MLSVTYNPWVVAFDLQVIILMHDAAAYTEITELALSEPTQ